jgi:hypothetical protein
MSVSTYEQGQYTCMSVVCHMPEAHSRQVKGTWLRAFLECSARRAATPEDVLLRKLLAAQEGRRGLALRRKDFRVRGARCSGKQRSWMEAARTSSSATVQAST